MTQRLANALLRIGGYALCLALVFMFVAGVQSFFDVAFAPRAAPPRTNAQDRARSTRQAGRLQ